MWDALTQKRNKCVCDSVTCQDSCDVMSLAVQPKKNNCLFRVKDVDSIVYAKVITGATCPTHISPDAQTVRRVVAYRAKRAGCYLRCGFV